MRSGRENLCGGVGKSMGVVEEGEGVDDVVGEGMGTGDGEGPSRVVLAGFRAAMAREY